MEGVEQAAARVIRAEAHLLDVPMSVDDAKAIADALRLAGLLEEEPSGYM